ncbi:hypothetical protein SOASR030_18480 [Leminorella grimontii]|uniref:Uncharacterized protein n=1 Tax=Leminorella grimontii TaxID=82981 RepID=A0AAV5N0U5_9GAMM|nr:hypothetical protein SOASR030_18480 [Leminorella grimontii]GKX59545.1 hypothetical protein SOASR031_18600 [Leminorella grimontii]
MNGRGKAVIADDAVFPHFINQEAARQHPIRVGDQSFQQYVMELSKTANFSSLAMDEGAQGRFQFSIINAYAHYVTLIGP